MTERSETPQESTPQDPAWEEALDWLFRLEAQPAEAGVAADWRRWMEAAPQHAAAFEQARSLWSLSTRLEPVALRQAPPDAKVVPLRARRGLRAAVAAAVSLAACLLLFLTAALPPQRSDFETAVGEIRSVTLEDGTEVALDSNSAIEPAFDAESRGVTLLRGQAFFAVTRDAARPFVIAAGPAQVTVLGTAFNLRLEAASLSLAVSEGRVALQGPDGQALGELTAGQTLRLDLVSGAVEQGSLDPAQIASWREGILRVERQPVGAVLAEIGRYLSFPILLADEALADQPVNGRYDLTRPLEAVAAVAAAYGATLRGQPPFLLIAPAD